MKPEHAESIRRLLESIRNRPATRAGAVFLSPPVCQNGSHFWWTAGYRDPTPTAPCQCEAFQWSQHETAIHAQRSMGWTLREREQ